MWAVLNDLGWQDDQYRADRSGTISLFTLGSAQFSQAQQQIDLRNTSALTPLAIEFQEI